MHERARPCNQVLLGIDAEHDLTIDHVEGLVPRVAVRRGTAALRAGLAEDLVAAGLCA